MSKKVFVFSFYVDAVIIVGVYVYDKFSVISSSSIVNSLTSKSGSIVF